MRKLTDRCNGFSVGYNVSMSETATDNSEYYILIEDLTTKLTIGKENLSNTNPPPKQIIKIGVSHVP